MKQEYYWANKCIKLKYDGLKMEKKKRTEGPPALLQIPYAIHSLSFQLHKNTQVRAKLSSKGKSQDRVI